MLRRSFARVGITYGYDDSSIVPDPGAATQYFTYINFQGVNGPNSLIGIKTSSITPSYSYNTVNHPISPTGGKSLFISTQFAGSVLGGNVNTIRPTIDFKYFKPNPLHRSHILAFHLMSSLLTGYGGKVAPPFSRTFIGGEQDIRGFEIWGITPIAYVASEATVPIYNNDGTPRTQKVVVNGVQTLVNASMNIPTYQLITPGGDTQVVGNFEYRIPIFGPVTLALFLDAGVNRILLPGELKMNPGRVAQLNALYPQAAFDGRVRLAPGTQNMRSSTGIELQVLLPVVQAPFRVYWAYNPQVVRQFLQPPIVADRAMFPNNETFLKAITSFGQGYPFCRETQHVPVHHRTHVLRNARATLEYRFRGRAPSAPLLRSSFREDYTVRSTRPGAGFGSPGDGPESRQGRGDQHPGRHRQHERWPEGRERDPDAV